MSVKQLTIILPVYNPSPGWEQLVLGRYREIKNSITDTAVQLTIVNDGSAGLVYSNGINIISKEVAELVLIENKKNKGKGNALRLGVSKMEADFYMLTDIDFPYTTESMKNIYIKGMEGFDIVMGTRDNNYYSNVSWFRAKLSKLLRFFIRNMLKIPFDDTQCGLKGFNNKGKEFFLQTTIDRYLFDLEFTILSVRNKQISLSPVPVKLREGIHLSKIPMKILLQEAGNFISLLFRKIN